MVAIATGIPQNSLHPVPPPAFIFLALLARCLSLTRFDTVYAVDTPISRVRKFRLRDKCHGEYASQELWLECNPTPADRVRSGREKCVGIPKGDDETNLAATSRNLVEDRVINCEIGFSGLYQTVKRGWLRFFSLDLTSWNATERVSWEGHCFNRRTSRASVAVALFIASWD